LALPILELAVFIAVVAMVGFGWALSLMLAGSLTGLLILRHLGSAHITRMRVVLGQGSFTALQADNRGGQVISAGILLLILGFITDFVALILLFAPLLPAMMAWSISPPDNGISYPIPHCPTVARTDAIAEPHSILNNAGRFRKRSCRRRTIPSLFPSRPYVSQPPRNYVRGARESS
jgi:UPF0716 family protein affecting phage T7 exclusion